MLTITYYVRGKKKKFATFCGHIYDKKNLSLLSEEFPFILLANLSATLAIWCILEKVIKYFLFLFISKTFQYFHVLIPQASCYSYS